MRNKRKRQGINQNDTHVNRSLSQLSISQESSTKKKRIPTTTENLTVMTTAIDNPSLNVLSNEVTDNNQTEMDLGNENKLLLPTKRIQQFKPHYLTLSDEIFKQMLSNAVQDGDQLVQCLNTDEKLQAVRQMTEVTNNLHYFDL